MISLGNPVRGPIAARGTAVPIGSFVVTSTFAEHVASGRGPGIDIGDGKCGSDIIAMGRGRISQTFHDPNGANVVRYDLLDYPGYNAGLAHMPSIEVAVGVTFPEGTLLGHIGTTGAAACHLHQGVTFNGVEYDWWPNLRQNQEADMDPSFSPKPNRTVTVNAGARHRTAPTTADPSNIAIGSDPGGPLGGALNLALMGTVVGEAVSGNAIWYAYWRPETKRVYYLHTSTTGPEVPWEATAGHSDQELIDTAKKAGHNAAVDVAAVGQKALADVAAKYP